MLNVLNTSLPIPMSSTVFLEGTEGRTGEACRSVQSCCLLSKGCRNHITVILCIPSVKTNSSKLTPLSTRLPHLSLHPHLSAGLCPSTPASPPTRNTPNMHNTELIPASAPTFLSSIPIGIKLDLQALSWVPRGCFHCRHCHSVACRSGTWWEWWLRMQATMGECPEENPKTAK